MKKVVSDINMTQPCSRGTGTLEEATRIHTKPPNNISKDIRAPEYVLRTSSPKGKEMVAPGNEVAAAVGAGEAVDVTAGFVACSDISPSLRYAAGCAPLR